MKFYKIGSGMIFLGNGPRVKSIAMTLIVQEIPPNKIGSHCVSEIVLQAKFLQ